VIVARTSWFNVLQLTFQECCDPLDRINKLTSQIDALNRQIEKRAKKWYAVNEAHNLQVNSLSGVDYGEKLKAAKADSECQKRKCEKMLFSANGKILMTKGRKDRMI
jgi:hypothetical protein